MGRMEREKGARFEREIADVFKQWGFGAYRTAQFRGNTGRCSDIEGVPDLHIECKHQERMCLYNWMKQAISDNRASERALIPVVIHKANKKPVLISMELKDFLRIFSEWEGMNGSI